MGRIERPIELQSPDNPASEPQSRSIAGRESAAQGAASTGSIGAIYYQLPGLFAVGPPRTATTWLDRVLRRSNSVSLAERIKETLSAFPWLVYEEHGEILGYAYASKWRGRCAYRYSAESSIYLRHDRVSRGTGLKLYAQLLAELRNSRLRSVIGGIALPNEASQRLHEKLGFKKVAHFEQVGWKLEKWIDVGYWQLILTGDPSEEPLAQGR